MRSTIALLFFSLTACSQSGERVAYYADSDAVSVEGVSGDAAEIGNLGGQVLTVTGSGFGDDADKVAVQFGSVNAEIIDVSSDEITVVSPKGPLSGGFVDIRVATAQGQGELLDAYEYQVNGATENQAGYILINDFWRDSFADTEEAAWVSGFGFFSSLEWYNSAFPRAHMGSIGWLGGNDSTGPEWVVQTPAYRPFAQAVDSLRLELPGDIALVNTNGSGSTCVVWQPETENADAGWVEGNCNEATSRTYDHTRLEYCEVQEFETNTNSYAAEWPIQTPFMVPTGESGEDAEARKASCGNGIDDNEDGVADGLDPLCHTTIQLDAPGTGFNDDTLELTFPEAINFELDASFDAIYGGGLETNSAVDFLGCASGVDDAVMVIEWEPSGVVYSEHPLIADVRTNVRFTIAQFQAGWYGVSGFPIQATIVVPDVHNLNPVTGRSQLVVTTELLDQFPVVSNYNQQACTTDLVSGAETCNFRTPDGNYGMLTYAMNRVTEYRLSNDSHPFSGETGDLVVAYATGTFGLSISDHTPAIDRGSCGNCADDDGDGWVDMLDADCIVAEEQGIEGVEDGQFDGFGCSDGVDNDGDGLVDADDVENCSDGTDGETNCGNGEDDDGDGWVDADDGECVDQNSSEEGADDPAWLCSDGIDNDLDGWIDSEDPGCLTGSGTDEGGFSGSACNDGVDNDGHMDVDAEDYYCVLNGASATEESPAGTEKDFSGSCADGEESEGEVSQQDGYWDAFDPACEKSPFFSEGSKGWKSTDPITTECYDNQDNDADGVEDADDPGCWNPDFGFEPDGFLNDESADWGTECHNGLDDDSDGLIDGLDPDCQPRNENFLVETVVGTTQCNDGVDNDGDEFIDAADPDCDDASDDSE